MAYTGKNKAAPKKCRDVAIPAVSLKSQSSSTLAVSLEIVRPSYRPEFFRWPSAVPGCLLSFLDARHPPDKPRLWWSQAVPTGPHSLPLNRAIHGTMRSHPGYTTPKNLPWWSLQPPWLPFSMRQKVHAWSELRTIPGSHLHFRCIETGSSPTPALAFYSSNGNAVVYLLLRSTKLVLTWCTALHGKICSRSNCSYALMDLHTTLRW